MKKLISGAIAGALLLTSVSVFADSASLVGKKFRDYSRLNKMEPK